MDTCDRPLVTSPEGETYRIMRCKYFDTNIAPGGRGNIGFNTFRSDGVENWNVALEREFVFRETGAAALVLLFRSEFINFMNRPQFAEPNLRMAAETFGYITNTANRGRIIQFLLKLQF